MKHISILVPQGNSVVDTIIGPYNLFKMANAQHQKLKGLREPLFTIDLVGISDQPVTYQGLFTIKPTAGTDSIQKTDLIIVSPISGNLEKGIEVNQPLVDWIKRQRIHHGAKNSQACVRELSFLPKQG